MAIANNYPMGTPKSGDLLLGTSIPAVNTNEKPTTRNFGIGDVASLINTGFAGGYKVYTALLTQAGNTNPPVATIMQNTLGGTITWTRTGPGAYTATIADVLFTLNKTMVFINGGSATATANIEWASPTTATVTIDTTADSVLTKASIEIRIYS